MLTTMAACPHCGGHAHLEAPCAALAPVRSALRFPGAFRQDASGRALFVRTLTTGKAQVAVTAFLVAGALGALFAAQNAWGLAMTGVFGVGAAVALAVAGTRAKAVRAAPGVLECYGDHGVSGLPARLTAAEVQSVSAQPAPEGYVILARSGAQDVPLLTGIRSKQVAERVGAELERIFKLEPFVGERALGLPGAEPLAAHARIDVRIGLSRAHADDDQLVIHPKLQRAVRIASDAVVQVELIERSAAPEATPDYTLELRTRRGEVLRPLPWTQHPRALARFVAQLRAHWHLDRAR